MPLDRRTVLTGGLAVGALAGCQTLAPPPSAPLIGPYKTLAGREVSPDALAKALTAAMARHNAPGASLAIVNDGALVYVNAFGKADVETGAPVTPNTVFEAASLAKPVFGQWVMTFVDAGRLDLDAPLWPILPLDGLADPRAALITPRMILTHTSGLPNWRSQNPDKRLDLAFDPGAGYRYSGEGFQWLAKALQKLEDVDAAGLDAAFRRRLARPVGVDERFAFFETPALRAQTARPHVAGKPTLPEALPAWFGAAGGLFTTAQNYARWTISAMQRQPVLSSAAYAQWLAPQKLNLPADLPDRKLGLVDRALGFAIHQLPVGRVHVHGGANTGFTCLTVADFDRGWSMSFFTNADQAQSLMIETMPIAVV